MKGENIKEIIRETTVKCVKEMNAMSLPLWVNGIDVITVMDN